jgi:excinuclease UvrABC helicase subunit UvrB
VYNYNVQAGPFINRGDTLQLFPGEKIFVEVERTGDEIKSMKAVTQNNHPEKTLTISFQQVVEKKTHKSMVLTIDNPFDKNLQYNAQIAMILKKKWESIDVRPAAAGLSSYQTWPQIIVSILLHSWRFVK